MKILHVGSPFTDFEGKFCLTFKFTQGLKSLGHDVEIATTDADCYFFDMEKSKMYQSIRKILLESEGKTIQFRGIPVHVFHSITPRFGMYCLSIKKDIEKIIGKYDVIHICSWYSHIGMSFAEMAHKYGIPFIVSPWGSLQPEARSLKKNMKVFADTKFTKKLVPHAYFHSVGKSETEALVKICANPEKIFHIDHPVDLEDFIVKKKTEIDKKIDFDPKNRYVLYLSRINKKKGLELLLNSFKRVWRIDKNIILIIAGSGEDEYVKEIKRLVSSLGISEAVKFTGLVSADEKLELLELASIFALTSHSDVHPIAVQEALTMGVPVVITRICDYPEVEEFEAGILVDENEQSIADVISSLVNDKSRLSQMSSNAKKLISERFLLGNQVKKHEEMYIDAIKKNKLHHNN
ncbi:MAG TPA: glycosyltransferase [Candidatus Nitrosotalea sp.]|nr:glycosyltransferase [Candidatus Nitrosotalea sp.]